MKKMSELEFSCNYECVGTSGRGGNKFVFFTNYEKLTFIFKKLIVFKVLRRLLKIIVTFHKYDQILSRSVCFGTLFLHQIFSIYFFVYFKRSVNIILKHEMFCSLFFFWDSHVYRVIFIAILFDISIFFVYLFFETIISFC